MFLSARRPKLPQRISQGYGKGAFHSDFDIFGYSSESFSHYYFTIEDFDIIALLIINRDSENIDHLAILNFKYETFSQKQEAIVRRKINKLLLRELVLAAKRDILLQNVLKKIMTTKRWKSNFQNQPLPVLQCENIKYLRMD